MSGSWWHRHPGRLEHELDELRAAGVAVARDEAAWRIGVLRLRLTASRGAGRDPVQLVATFPDTYPYFRPTVAAPGLALRHHQHPASGDLCLLGRATATWRPSDTLARLLSEQLPRALAAGAAAGADAATALEERQAEPVTDYYRYAESAMLLVDGSWRVPTDARGGWLTVGLHSGDPLAGAVLSVAGEDRAELAAADPAIAERYARHVQGRWVRLADAPRPGDSPEGMWADAVSLSSALARLPWQGVSPGLKVQVVGLLLPTETGWRAVGEGWVFLVRARREAVRRGGVQQTTALVRAGYAGRSDLAARVPHLAALPGKRALLVGLGGLGGTVALELAKAGVGELALLDRDHLEPGNVVRHAAGLLAAGRPKALAVAELIHQNVPYTRLHLVGASVGSPRAVPPAAGDQQDEWALLKELVSGADIVVDATAELGVQQLLADLARAAGVPYVCASATNGGWGGLLARVVPADTPGCWVCLQHHLHDGGMPLPPADPSSPVQPAGCADPTFTAAGFDVAWVALAAVRMAVATLVPGGSGYGRLDHDVAVVRLRDGEGLPCAPRYDGYQLERHRGCPAHDGLDVGAAA